MTSPFNILVVEDDQNVALAIEAMLVKGFTGSRVIRVSNCRMAMDCLQTDPIKLIISDWNMPSRTGADLLLDVRKANRTCNIPFLMLTARSDRESVVTAIKNGANDYICKPFEKTSMLTKVGKLLGVAPTLPKERPTNEISASSLDAPQLASQFSQPVSAPAENNDKTVVNQIAERLRSGNLGSLMLPSVAMKIQEIINSAEPSVDLICDAVKLDPALTTKLIGISNSSYYMSSSRCNTLREAIMRIGFREASHCIMALTTKELFSAHDPLLNDILQQEWKHALATGFCAEKLVKQVGLPNAEDYFTMGLLHDVGKVLLLNILQDISRNRALPSQADILKLLDSQHSIFGRELLKRWNFPQPFVDLAQYHHDPESMRQCAPGLQIVQFCNLVAAGIGKTDTTVDLGNPEIQDYAHRLGIDLEVMPPVLEEIENYLAHLF